MWSADTPGAGRQWGGTSAKEKMPLWPGPWTGLHGSMEQLHKHPQPPFGNAGFEPRQAWALIPSLQLPSWAILGKLHTSLSLICQSGMAFMGWLSGFCKYPQLVLVTSFLHARQGSGTVHGSIHLVLLTHQAETVTEMMNLRHREI